MKRHIEKVAIVICLAALVVALIPCIPLGHRLTIKAYFTNAMGLRPGAAVRSAGVDIGSVKSVRPRPELKESPVEVVLVVKTADDLRVPNDSTALLATAGIPGETYVEIDCRNASGPPIAPGGTLKTQPAVSLSTEQLLEKLTTALKERCDCDSKKDPGKVSKARVVQSRDAN